MRPVARKTFAMLVRQAKEVGRTKLRIAGAARFGNNKETQCNALANCRRDCMSIDPVTLEIFKRNGQTTVIVTAMMGQLDLDTTKKPVRRQAEYSIGGRFDQFDQPGRKLPANLVALLETCHGAAIGGTIAPETLMIL